MLRFALFFGPDSSHVRQTIASVRRGWAPIPDNPGSFVSSASHDDAAIAVVAGLCVRSGVHNVVEDERVKRSVFHYLLADALGVRHPIAGRFVRAEARERAWFEFGDTGYARTAFYLETGGWVIEGIGRS